MNAVTLLWSTAVAGGALIAIVHATIWIHDRRARSSLALVVAALALVGVAICELGMMGSSAPAQWAHWVRWTQVPIFALMVSLAVFVRSYLGAGHAWMMWSVIALRSVILVANFAVQPTFNFASVADLGVMPFLGQEVAVLGSAKVGPFQWVATASVILLVAYVADATLTAWRRHPPESQRKVLIVGAGTLLFVSLSGAFTQLVIWGFVQLPMLITPPYLILLLALGYELGRDALRAGQLSRDLRESGNWLELAVDSAQLGLWTLDARRQRIWATDRSRDLLGFGADEDLDLDRVCAQLHVEDRERVRAALERSFDAPTGYYVEFRVLIPGQTAPRWIASQGTVECGEDGRIALVRGTLRNVSDQKLAKAEADRLRSELSHSGRVNMLGRLASALAHELCQPLATILRNVEAAGILLVRPEPDLQQVRAILSDIHRDDQRASDIIERLRSLLKRRELQFHPLSLESLLTDANLLVRADAAAKNVALECLTQGPLPMVAGDRVHLSQVLINLVQNGIDASCEVERAPKRVTVTARTLDTSTVEIAVADSGTGLGAEARSRLFEPFFTTKPGGLGMGLSVSRTIVEAHGGSLRAENQMQGGAVFRIHLPALQVEAA